MFVWCVVSYWGWCQCLHARREVMEGRQNKERKRKRRERVMERLRGCCYATFTSWSSSCSKLLVFTQCVHFLDTTFKHIFHRAFSTTALSTKRIWSRLKVRSATPKRMLAKKVRKFSAETPASPSALRVETLAAILSAAH